MVGIELTLKDSFSPENLYVTKWNFMNLNDKKIQNSIYKFYHKIYFPNI